MKNLSKKFIIAAAAAASICASTAYATAFPCPIGAPCMFTGNTIVVQPTGGTGGGFQCPPGIMINGQICGGGSQTGSGNGGNGSGGNNNIFDQLMSNGPKAFFSFHQVKSNNLTWRYRLNINGVNFSFTTNETFSTADHLVQGMKQIKDVICSKNSSVQFKSGYIDIGIPANDDAIQYFLRNIKDQPCPNSSNGGNTGTK